MTKITAEEAVKCVAFQTQLDFSFDGVLMRSSKRDHTHQKNVILSDIPFQRVCTSPTLFFLALGRVVESKLLNVEAVIHDGYAISRSGEPATLGKISKTWRETLSSSSSSEEMLWWYT